MLVVVLGCSSSVSVAPLSSVDLHCLFLRIILPAILLVKDASHEALSTPVNVFDVDDDEERSCRRVVGNIGDNNLILFDPP